MANRDDQRTVPLDSRRRFVLTLKSVYRKREAGVRIKVVRLKVASPALPPQL